MRTPLTIACWLVALTLLFVPACQREVNDPNLPHPTPGGGEKVTATVTGRITDQSNSPVKDAVVRAGTTFVTTDINGVFRISNVLLNKNAGFIQVEKTGFFQGSRTIIVHEGTTNYISIQLIKKNVSGTVSGAGSGTVTVANGGSIAFSAGSFVNAANNTAYTGTVSVSAFFLDPAADNFNDIMPGTLRGIDSSNAEKGLQSFGMMAVELNGSAGEKLQLATGKPATITFPIPTGLLAQAPAAIPLWSFNDTTGLWKQEGTATRQGNNYIGTVKHFSFWNCDYPLGLVDFTAVFKDQSGNALYPAQVELKTTGDKISSYGYGYTDSTGMVSGKVPSGKAFQLSVVNKCHTALYNTPIGPFTANVNLGTITVTNTGISQLVLTGTVINCTAGAVANGFVDAYIDSAHYRALINNGNFSLPVMRCSNATTTVGLTAYDLDASQNGAMVNISVTAGTVPVGQLSACGNTIAQFINYTLNGAASSFVPPADSISLMRSTGNNFALQTYRTSPIPENMYLAFTATGTGTVPVTNFIVSKGNSSYVKQAAFNMNITEFGSVGGYIAGNFSAVLKDSNSTSTTPVNLTFRARRVN